MLETLQEPIEQIKIETPTNDDTYDPYKFFDWLTQMDEFLDQYHMDDYQRTIFVKIKIKLVHNAKKLL